jgi:hypothetical protein
LPSCCSTQSVPHRGGVRHPVLRRIDKSVWFRPGRSAAGAQGLTVAGSSLHSNKDPAQPTSRRCSADESVARATVSSGPEPYPSMGFVPLQGLHRSAAPPVRLARRAWRTSLGFADSERRSVA